MPLWSWLIFEDSGNPESGRIFLFLQSEAVIIGEDSGDQGSVGPPNLNFWCPKIDYSELYVIFPHNFNFTSLDIFCLYYFNI